MIISVNAEIAFHKIQHLFSSQRSQYNQRNVKYLIMSDKYIVLFSFLN